MSGCMVAREVLAASGNRGGAIGLRGNGGGVFGERVHELIFDRVRELAETAVNETILYWLMGLADGSDGDWNHPEICVEFPFLLAAERVEPLTMTYSVTSQDATRSELNRIDLHKALMRSLEDSAISDGVKARAKVVADSLRGMADYLEQMAAKMPADGD